MGLNVERHGKGEKLLFIHGAGGSSSSFYFQRQYLQHSSEVILLDLPGHGKSGGEGSRDTTEYAEIVEETISNEGVDGCYLVGHSMGGLVAMSLTLVRPELVKGLVLIGTGARLRVLPEILEGVIEDKERAVRMIMGLAFSRKTAPLLMQAAVLEMMKTPAEVIFGDFYACEQVDVMEKVKGIAVPTLIICGTDDVLTPLKYSEYLNRVIPGSKLVSIQNAGHMVTLEKPEEVNRAIETFVARQ
jgi:pimeloyl-ACP methyl ester carboxylesterase